MSSKEIVVVEDETKKIFQKQVISLNFDCYEFFKFIDTLSKYVNELEFIFENRELTITFMDASRIMLSKCKMYLNNSHGSENLDKMVFGINTDDLMKILRVRKTDLKTVELTFDNTKTFIQIIKTSEKFNSIIMKSLNTLDLNLELIPIENLEKIYYPAKVKFSTKFLNDFFYEASVFSEIVTIEINKEEGISFSEEGVMGNSKYLIKQEYCEEIDIKKEEKEICNNYNSEKGSYAYSFLTPIKPLLPILKNSNITLNLKENHPIKLELRIESLDINMIIYLAPRIEECDYDDYDDMDEF